MNHFQTLNVPERKANQAAAAYNDILLAAFGNQPVTPTRKKAYLVLSQQYDSYFQIHRTKTLYDTLGVSKTASNEDIKKAYRQLSMKVHPDRWNTADPMLQEQATENQARVTYAFQILSERRAEYDQAGCPYILDGAHADDDSAFDDFEFEDDMWVPSGSEAEESSGESKSSSPPPRRRAKPRAPRAKTTTRQAPRAKRAKKTNSPPSEQPPPPPPDAMIHRKIVTASLYQLYRGFTAAVEIETSVLRNDTWVKQMCHMNVVVAARTGPGLVKVFKQAGVYRPGMNTREDVHIHVQLEDVAYPFALKGQDIVVNFNIPLDVAVRGDSTLAVTMPDNMPADFVLTQPVHELEEIAYAGRGLKFLETGLVGGIILRFHVQYPAWSLAQRHAVADFMLEI